MRKWNLCWAALLGCTLLRHAEGGGHTYVVQPGDSLSQIAADYISRPIFTKDGSLSKLLELNPWLRRDIDKIYPGESIFLVEKEVGMAARSPLSQRKPASQGESEALQSQESFALTPSKRFVPHSHLGLDFGFEYFRIDSTDRGSGSTATFLSNMSPDVRVTWDLDWSEKWTSRLRLLYGSENVLDTTSATATIENASGSRFEFEAGPIYHWSEAVRTGIFLGTTQKVFTWSPSLSQVDIGRVQEVELKVSQEVDLVRVDAAVFGLGLSVYGLSSGTGPGYSTNPGWGGDISGHLRHGISKYVTIEGRAYYGIWQQNSGLENQNEKHLGVTLGITGSFAE